MKHEHRQIRLGVIGAGTMGQHHVRIMSRFPGVIFSGLYDPNAARAQEICLRHGCEAFTGLDELLEQTDAVVVAAPTTLHYEIGIKCLRKGIHVLMEKPLAHGVDAAEKLVQTAREAGLILMAGHVERYNPAVGKLMELLNSPQEEIVSIDVRRLAPFDGSRCMDVDVLYDLLIHDVDLALEIAGSPVGSVSAFGRPVFSRQTDAAHVRIQFDNGTMAVFWTAKCSPRKMRLITVSTPRRFLVADTLSRSLSVSTADRLPTPGREICFMGDIRSEDVPVPDEEPLVREIADFVHAIRNGTKPIVDGMRALHALRALELVAKSIQSGGSLVAEGDR